ncbi:MAG: hypothetical protein ACR2HN_04160, partial [Tepidiformaceae bacterium]
PTPTPAPPPHGDLLGGYVSSTPGAFVLTRFAPGAAIDPASGMYFMDTATGAVERWAVVTLDPEPGTGTRAYRASPDGRFVIARDPPFTRLLDRQTGNSFGWEDELLSLLAVSADSLLLEFVSPAPQQSMAHSGRLLLVDAAFNVIERFSLAATQYREAVFAPDGSRMIVAGIDDGSGTTTIWLLEKSGVVALLERLQPEGVDARLSAGVGVVGGPGSVGTPYVRGYKADPGLPDEGFLSFYDWAGDTLSSARSRSFLQHGDISPDGKLLAVPELYAVEEPCQEGCHLWPSALVVDAASGQPLYRVKGAGAGGWLADSSGFVVVTGGDPADLDGEGLPMRYGYAVMSADGSVMRRLPLSSDNRGLAPTPAPDRVGLFALGRTTVVDLVAGTTQAAAIPGSRISGFYGPWGSDSREIRFTVPSFGQGGSAPILLPTPVIERPPSPAPAFGDAGPLGFVVARTGSCLNARDTPGLAGAILTCFPDGTDVVRHPGPLDNWPGVTAATMIGGRWWVRVSDGAQSGWVVAGHLDWR